MVFHPITKTKAKIHCSAEEYAKLDSIIAETTSKVTEQSEPIKLSEVVATCAYVENNDILNIAAVGALMSRQMRQQQAHHSLIAERLNKFFTEDYVKQSELVEYLTERKRLVLALQNNSPDTAFVESVLYGSCVSFMLGKLLGYISTAFPVGLGLYASGFIPLILRDIKISTGGSLEEPFFKGVEVSFSLPSAAIFLVAAAPLVLVVGFFAYLAKKIFSSHTQHKIEQLDKKYTTNPGAQKMRTMMDYLVTKPQAKKELASKEAQVSCLPAVSCSFFSPY